MEQMEQTFSKAPSQRVIDYMFNTRPSSVRLVSYDTMDLPGLKAHLVIEYDLQEKDFIHPWLDKVVDMNNLQEAA